VESAVLKVLQESEAGQRVTKRVDVRSAKKQKSTKSTRAYNTMPSGFDAPASGKANKRSGTKCVLFMTKLLQCI
jgi:hypothetical protein